MRTQITRYSKHITFFILSFLAVLSLCQCALIYPGAYSDNQNTYIGIEKIELTTSDNIQIELLKNLPAKNSQKAILMFHGNADLASNQLNALKDLGLNYDLFALEYRGYSNTKGSPSEKNFHKDALAALQYIKDNNYKTIIYYAHSIGTGVAINLTKEHTPDALILETPFTTLADLGKETLPFLPKWFIDLVLIDEYNNIETLSSTEIPNLLIMHGEKDSIISFSQGKKLFDKAKSPNKVFKAYPLGDHNDLYFMNRQDLKTFIESI